MTVQDVYAGDRRYSVSGVGYGADGEILLNHRHLTWTNASRNACRQVFCAMIPIYKSRTGSAWLWAIQRKGH